MWLYYCVASRSLPMRVVTIPAASSGAFRAGGHCADLARSASTCPSKESICYIGGICPPNPLTRMPFLPTASSGASWHDFVRGGASTLHDDHLQRLAIVYVRQSHPQHVVEHVESTARQDALVDRAVALGWSRDRVVVMDEDQGQSGQSLVTRLGFQRVVAEGSLDPVGLILGLEMRRLARSNKDWQQWLALCAIVRTWLADAEGLYDPTDSNDRFL